MVGTVAMAICFGPLLAVASENGNMPATSSQEGERDFPARWVETKAYVNASAEVREAMLSLARVAKEYDTKTEDELMALPGRKEVKIHPLGDTVNIKVSSPDGGSKEFHFIRPENHLQYVIVVDPEGSRVLLNYTTPRYRMLPMNGSVSNAKSGRTWSIDFDVKNDGHLKSATSWVGNRRIDAGFLGWFILWDTDGNIAFQKEYKLPKTLSEIGADVRATLGEEKARVLGFVREERQTDAFNPPKNSNVMNQDGQIPVEGEK